MTEHTVLFVDDEKNILKALQRLFLDEEYAILTAESGKEALSLLDSGETPTVIVSDQRMPEMGGAEFLALAKERQPESIRMVLTGYADINAAVDAVNKGGIYRYIMKPWNDDDLKLTVKDAIDRFELVQKNRELTAELVEKNKALEELNATLEEKVEERTKTLRLKVKELKARDRIQEYLLTVHPLDELLQTVLEIVVDVTSASGAAFYLIDQSIERGIRMTKCFQFNGGPGLEDAQFLDTVKGMVESGTPCSCRVEDHEKRNLWGVPVCKGDQKLGALVVHIAADRSLASEERQTITGFAMQAAIGISDSKMRENLDDIGDSLDDVLVDFQ